MFKYLNSQKIYYQKHYKRAPGTPDIALPRKKVACFVDGDFWHGRSLNKLIARRGIDDPWTQKIINNMRRDDAQRSELAERGWKIISVWESDILRKRSRKETLDSVQTFLTKDTFKTELSRLS